MFSRQMMHISALSSSFFYLDLFFSSLRSSFDYLARFNLLTSLILSVEIYFSLLSFDPSSFMSLFSLSWSVCLCCLNRFFIGNSCSFSALTEVYFLVLFCAFFTSFYFFGFFSSTDNLGIFFEDEAFLLYWDFDLVRWRGFSGFCLATGTLVDFFAFANFSLALTYFGFIFYGF